MSERTEKTRWSSTVRPYPRRPGIVPEMPPPGDLPPIDLVKVEGPRLEAMMFDIATLADTEMGWDYLWEPDLPPTPECVGYLITDEHGAAVGGVAFHWRRWVDLPPSWGMTWVWLYPGARRRGFLTRLWPRLVELHSPFRPEGPFSEEMDYFMLQPQRREEIGAMLAAIKQGGRGRNTFAHRREPKAEGPSADPLQHWETPDSLAPALVLGLPRLGIELPERALDPCGGAGGLRRGLGPFGIDLKLTDIAPSRYLEAPFVDDLPLDARSTFDLRHALARSRSRVVITNPPFANNGAPRIAKAALSLIEEGVLDTAALLLRMTWVSEQGRAGLRQHPSYRGKIVAAWRPSWIAGTDRGQYTFAWFVWSRPYRIDAAQVVYVEEREAIAAALEGAAP